ncbi:hypothetical protein EZI54_22390 [Marinobacter halodurans]|uniref:Transmembrane protein n=1 Tax=Marinobacter halodurans TaxID=2528979 RepID=A0ABY1ZDU4_9GAMM|nr:hypothetical protein [Marinobacter halodurans]TBW47621.1 hypothetical protein EZI54_22390 [Marinobacter halodurans]
MVGVYKFCLAAAMVAFVGATTFAVINLSTLPPGGGNGGAFLAALSFGVGLLGLTIATPLAWIAAGISYVCRGAMPKGALWHYAVPTVVALPGTVLLLVVAWSSI